MDKAKKILRESAHSHTIVDLIKKVETETHLCGIRTLHYVLCTDQKFRAVVDPEIVRSVCYTVNSCATNTAN